MNQAIDQARALETAIKNSEVYARSDEVNYSAASNTAAAIKSCGGIEKGSLGVSSPSEKCFFCGNLRHPRKVCPARDTACHNCGKTGHYAKVCRSTKKESKSASIFDSTIASVIKSQIHNQAV